MPDIFPDELAVALGGVVSRTRASGIADRLPGLATRGREVPDERPVQDPPADPAEGVQCPQYLAALVQRGFLNDAYVYAYREGPKRNAGRVGHLAAAKLAIDYLATYERAVQAANAGRVRCRAWAAGRRLAHGDLDKGLFRSVTDAVVSVWVSGEARDNAAPQS